MPNSRELIVAKIRHGRSTLELRSGGEIDFGRASARSIRLGAEPADDGVSRAAGRIAALTDGVLIWNDSTSRNLELRPRVGPSRVIEPGEGRTSQPYRWLDVVVAGTFGEHVLEVVVLDRAGRPQSERAAGTPTAYAKDIAAQLSPQQRLLLAALCRPLMTRRGGEAVPATYKQVGTDLGLSQGTVRNGLSEIRERLHGAGIRGLVGQQDHPSPGADFRAALAGWAMRAGAFDQVELDELDRRSSAAGTGDR